MRKGEREIERERERERERTEKRREEQGEKKIYLRRPASPTNHRHLSSRRRLSAASTDPRKLDLHYFPAFHETLTHHPRHDFLSIHI